MNKDKTTMMPNNPPRIMSSQIAIAGNNRLQQTMPLQLPLP
jgi:hypothetical protein